jgi:tryptophan-rich sensory protein
MDTTVENARPRRESRPHQGLALLLFVALSHAAGLVGVAIGGQAQLYSRLVKPEWAPPAWLFGPVWMVLYTLMGVAAWMVWRSPYARPRHAALQAFHIQLALNALWTPVFFGLERIDYALGVILALVVAVVLTIVRFNRASRPAAALLLPYLAWVGFAAALNFRLWQLNP